MRKGILIGIVVILLGIFAFCAWQALSIWREYRVGETFYEDLDQFVSVPAPTEEKKPVPEAAEEDLPEAAVPEESVGPAWPEVDFAALQEINSDVVGWIYVPNTWINYPVLQGEDNDTYIYHLMNGKYNSAGSIFLEAGISPDFTEQNSVIYGHNMKNGSMFADLAGFKSQAYYDSHKVGMLLTPQKQYYVDFFSGYVTESWGNAWDSAFSEESYGKWLDERIRKSYFSSHVVPTTEDRILTLSTCSYESDDARFVVHGVLREYLP